MKILQTIGGMNVTGGGTVSCTAQLFEAMHQLDSQVKLLTIAPKDIDEEVLGNGTDWLWQVPYDVRTPLAYSRNFRNHLRTAAAEVLHTNGLWMYINHITCSFARKRNIPYVISPHGMLYPEALARSKWKKHIVEWLWFNQDISQATAFHVTCEQEMKYVRDYGYRGPIAVIGNPVSIPDYLSGINHRITTDNSHIRKIGFLGRLHPRKQVERIFQGVARLPLNDQKQFRIIVIGSGSPEYERFLNEEAALLGIRHLVEFKGFLSGKSKFEQLADIDALFVPSDMENFGMIVPEALLVNTPVMASTGTPWQILEEERCGWWRPASAESIAGVLREILAATPGELRGMGRRGAEMVRRHYAAPIIAAKMLALYRWILSGGEKPEFVYTL